MENMSKKSRIYSEQLKQIIVSEVKAGVSVAQVSKKYGVEGHMTVYRWCEKYGVKISTREIIDVPLDILTSKIPEPLVKKKMPKEVNDKSLEDKLKLMEYELALYKKMVEIAKRDYDLDLVKKLDTKPSKK